MPASKGVFVNCKRFGLYLSVITLFFFYLVACITYAATVDTSKVQPKKDDIPVPSMQVPVKPPAQSPINPTYGIGSQQQPNNVPTPKQTTPSKPTTTEPTPQRQKQPSYIPPPAQKRTTPSKPPTAKPAPQQPADMPAVPKKPVIENPSVLDHQLRELKRLQNQLRKLRDQTRNEQTPNVGGSDAGGQTVDDLVNRILRESNESIKRPTQDSSIPPHVLTLAEILKNARPIMDEPSELAPISNSGYFFNGEEDCDREGYSPHCVSDVFSCNEEGECRKVGEKIYFPDCWGSDPGVVSCDIKTVYRTCYSDGRCVTTKVKLTRQDCEGVKCKSRTSVYVCVPPGESEADFTCPDSSRRSRDNEYTESDREGSTEWSCDDETDRCEVTRNDSGSREDGSTWSSTEIFNCPDNLRNTELSSDCNMRSSTYTECNESGCHTQSYDDQGNEENIVTHEDGSENRRTEQCNTTTGRCVVTDVTTSTDQYGNTTRTERRSDCSLRVDERQTCDTWVDREEICTTRTGRNPRTGETITLPRTCTLSEKGPLPIAGLYPDRDFDSVTASGCPPGTSDPENECDRSETWNVSCGGGECTGTLSKRVNTPGLQSTVVSTCVSPPGEECIEKEREIHTTIILPDGSVHTYDEEKECYTNSDGVETDICWSNSITSSCTADGLRCTRTTTDNNCESVYHYLTEGRRVSGFYDGPACHSASGGETSESWTSTCNTEGECVREGTRDVCQEVRGSRCVNSRSTHYRVEETCDRDAIADGQRTHCQVTLSSESYWDNGHIEVNIQCNLETQVCTKAVSKNGTTTRYTCTPETPAQSSPYTNCAEGVVGITSGPAPETR